MSQLFRRRGYTIAPCQQDLSAAALRAALSDWLAQVNLGPGDAIVFYVTGHGCVVDGDHYLCGRGFDKAMAATTGFKTQDLLELALRRSPRPAKVWLIVDCCAAGGVLGEGLYRALGTSGADTFVLAASDSWSETFDGWFSAAFQDALAEIAQGMNSSISLDQLTHALNQTSLAPRAVQAAVSTSRFDLLDTAAAAADGPAGRRGAASSKDPRISI